MRSSGLGGLAFSPKPSEPPNVKPRDDNSGLPVRRDLKDCDCFGEGQALIKGGHKAEKLGALSTNDVD